MDSIKLKPDSVIELTEQFHRKTQNNNTYYYYYYTNTCNAEYMVLFITHSLIISLRHEEARRSGGRTPHIPASELVVVYPSVSRLLYRQERSPYDN